MATARTAMVGTGAAAALLLVAGLAPPASAAPARPAAVVRTCPAPTITPDAEWTGSVGTAPNRPGTELPTIEPDPISSFLDMDADGTADTATGPIGAPVAVHRGDGNLTVEGIPGGPGYGGGIDGYDLDGDGRSELVVWRREKIGSGIETTTWVVPGTTPPGTVDVGSVGFTFTGTVTGDVTGDGLPDLRRTVVFVVLAFPTGWVSGADRMATIGSPQPWNGLDVVGDRADLDFDGKADAIHLGSPLGGIAPKIVLSTGATLSAQAPNAQFARAYRAGSRTIVQYAPFADGPDVRGYAIHTACADAWMRSATKQFMGRNPTAADYVGFGPTSEPSAAQRLARTEAMVRSQSARNLQITTTYAFYLDRPADPVGRAYWLKRLRNGSQTLDAMTATLLGSREFRIKRTGGDPQSWVEAVFPKAMGRNADPAGRTYWTQQASTYGPQRTAARMLASPESRRYRIRSLHDSFYVLGGPQPAAVVAQGLADYDAYGFESFYARLLARDTSYLLAQSNNRMKLA